MNLLVIFTIVFIYTAILWVVVLFIYSAFIESFDFGALSTFALKSVLQVSLVAAVATFVPFGGYLALLVWALGLLIIFQKDLWESPLGGKLWRRLDPSRDCPLHESGLMNRNTGETLHGSKFYLQWQRSRH